MACLINVLYGCKKETSKTEAIKKIDNNAIKKDSNAVKTGLSIESGKMVYNEIKGLKKVSNYADGPMQSLNLNFKNLAFKIRYIEDRAYIQYAVDGRIIQDWQFCNANFYYDSSYEIMEKDSHLLYNGVDFSGFLLFPSFTEEYSTYFVYEFTDNKLQYVKDVILNMTPPAETWSNVHTFKAIREKNAIQISLTDNKGKEYRFEDRERFSENESSGDHNLSNDLILLNSKK
ncbi:hypothetical protein EG347_08070 [Chryseobacterium sp. G0186]|uniref:hypothetical protein n=1 Tax=Chryseobacterium sp. G0186 TaxID=2487064 RepID=UPI000F4FF2E0|nr:hypothetical protein [Chryseobacterium sp. G0186]AZA77470.1 hypothetical protein EG347_08070 [Chryseobacterium sp. G0186]